MNVKPGYKQTEVGVIPEEWEVAKLGDLKPFVTSGSRGWAPYYSERGDLFVRITNLSRSRIYLDLTDCKFVSLPPEASEGVRTQLNEHDVLISITADIGIVGYIDASVPSPAYINQHIALVRFNSSKTSGKFVSYFLASEATQKLFRAATDTGAKAGMSLLTVQKIQTALPPLPEQRAISEALSDADALIASLEELIAKKRLIKQATMQQLLAGKTRLPGFTGKWEVKRLGEVATVIGGGTPSTSVKEYWNGDIDWFTPTEIIGLKYSKSSSRRISYTGLTNSSAKILPAKAILMTTRASIGDLMILTSEATTNQGFQSLIVNDNIDNEFIYYVMLTKKDELLKNASGSTFLEISPKKVKSIAISMPPLPEQTAIAEVLSDMDAALDVLEEELTKARQVKQGMMQELLTGRIRLPKEVIYGACRAG